MCTVMIVNPITILLDTITEFDIYNSRNRVGWCLMLCQFSVLWCRHMLSSDFNVQRFAQFYLNLTLFNVTWCHAVLYTAMLCTPCQMAAHQAMLWYRATYIWDGIRWSTMPFHVISGPIMSCHVYNVQIYRIPAYARQSLTNRGARRAPAV